MRYKKWLIISLSLIAISCNPAASGTNSTDEPRNQDLQKRLQALDKSVNTLRAELAESTRTIQKLRESQAELEQEITILRDDEVFSFSKCIRIEGGVIEGLSGPHVIIEGEKGCNLHVRDGSGPEPFGGKTNRGRGNLILGYNLDISSAVRSGVHYLIIGNDHSFTGDGGIVTGLGNKASPGFVIGGSNNRSSGGGSVIGGQNNVTDKSGVIIGGAGNEIFFTDAADAHYNVIVGGHENTIKDGWGSSIFGGEENKVQGSKQVLKAVVVGGRGNIASAEDSAIFGGLSNKADGTRATVVGGSENKASGMHSTVLGGFDNNASGEKSTVSGGRSNGAGGIYSTVSGGQTNVASNEASSVSGGVLNEAKGKFSSVCGGGANKANGQISTLSGGQYNSANGFASSVSGGQNRTATAIHDWVAGSLIEDF